MLDGVGVICTAIPPLYAVVDVLVPKSVLRPQRNVVLGEVSLGSIVEWLKLPQIYRGYPV